MSSGSSSIVLMVKSPFCIKGVCGGYRDFDHRGGKVRRNEQSIVAFDYLFNFSELNISKHSFVRVA
ncbi:hypothetical protein QFZ73_003666 [Peribacillus sp. V2I11]|nr:hypothetical protein [Peribacillus sp. V2I11]